MRIKSAQIPDFTDVNVRRVFGYAHDVLQTQQKFEVTEKLKAAEIELLMSNQHISLQELASTPLWEYLQKILGPDHWTFNPNRGI
jgi:hypothetical protein